MTQPSSGPHTPDPATQPPGSRSVTRTQAGRDIAGQLYFRITNLALGVVTTLVLVRALGDDLFGQWTTILAVLGLAGSFGISGLSNVAIERAAADPAESARWVGALVTLRLTLTPIVTATSLIVCFLVADSRSMQIAAVVVNTVLLTVAIGSSRIVFQLRVKNATVSAVELANGVAWAGAVLLVAVLGPTLLAIAIAFAIVTNVTNIGMWFLARREHPIQLRGARSLWRPLAARGLPFALAAIVTLGYGQIDQILVFQIAGSAQAGLYGAAYRIYERLHIFPAAIMATLFPVLVAARDENLDRVKRVFKTAIDFLVIASLPALTITLAGPEALCVMLFGEQYAASSTALPILMASLVVISLGHLTGYLMISYSLQRVFVAVAFLALFFNVGANLIFIPRYGFVAAAWITLATEVLVLSITMTMLCRRIGVWPVTARLPRIVASAVAVGAIAFAGHRLGLPTVVWAGLAGLAYVPILVATRSIRVHDLRAIVSRTQPRPIG